MVAILKEVKNPIPAWDGINPKIVKQTCIRFLEPIVHVANISRLHGVFPDEVRITTII